MNPDTANASSANENTASDSHSDLDSVFAQFDDWRSRHVGRRHIPDALWAAAIALLDRYPTSVVSQKLRLNSARLQQHRDRSAIRARSKASPGKPKQSSKRKTQHARLSAPQASPDFLQLSALNPTLAAALKPPLPLRPAEATCSIIIERGDGSRFTVRIPAGLQIIESLCTSFLRQ